MEGSITTFYELRSRQEESHPEWVLDLIDKFFVEHGTGSDRNRVFTIEELRDFLGSYGFESINIRGGQHTASHMDGDNISVDENQTYHRVAMFADKIELSFKEEVDDHLVDRVVTLYIGNDSKFHVDKDTVVAGSVSATGDVVADGEARGTNIVGSKAKSYTGNTRPTTSAYYEMSHTGMKLTTGASSSRCDLEVSQGDNGGYDFAGVESVKSYTGSTAPADSFSVGPEGITITKGSGANAKSFVLEYTNSGYRIAQALKLVSSLDVGSNLSVNGSASVGNGLSVTGNTNMTDDLVVGGSLGVSGYINAASVTANTRKIEKTVTVDSDASAGTVNLNADEKGYVLVKHGSGGTVTVTESNTSSTCTLVKNATYDRVYQVIRIGSQVYPVVS